jgi:hypothetical protein
LTTAAAVFCAATCLLAGITAFAMRSSSALPVEDATPQMPNRAIKANRMASLLPVALTSSDQQASFTVASAPQSGDLEGLYNTVTTAQPMIAVPEPKATASTPANAEPAAFSPEPKKPEAVAALSVPPEKPKRQAAVTPAAPPAPSTMLDDGAIAGLKTRLHLTADQMEYWPAVESALREVARTQLRHTGKQMHTGRVNIDVNSAEVQQLIWAAMPLLMRLRDYQKSEVRKLARIIGLEQVAA